MAAQKPGHATGDFLCGDEPSDLSQLSDGGEQQMEPLALILAASVSKLCATDLDEPTRNRTINQYKYLYQIDDTKNQWLTDLAATLS